jgi:hypothetical protein
LQCKIFKAPRADFVGISQPLKSQIKNSTGRELCSRGVLVTIGLTAVAVASAYPWRGSHSQEQKKSSRM